MSLMVFDFTVGVLRHREHSIEGIACLEESS